jgi:hypothetical protein
VPCSLDRLAGRAAEAEPLSEAPKAYDRMSSGKARFRVDATA